MEMAGNAAKRAEKISKRRAAIPKLYRPVYDRAVGGKSRKAAIYAFCLECVCWQREEVLLCTALACPLYAVRPYQTLRKRAKTGRAAAQNAKTPDDT